MDYEKKQIGINNIKVYIPAYFVDQNKLDEYRGRESLRTYNGLGQRYMAVPSSCEDAVTMAANASIKILDQDHISPKDIGLLIVGTESGHDKAKAVSAHLHGLLKLSSDVENYEIKYACLGGSIALSRAYDWIKLGKNKGRSALVVCSDIARYEPGSRAEPTQGAGAVAALISENPKLITFDEPIGIYSENVGDFCQPINSLYAKVHGPFSLECYSKAIKGAYRDYKGKGGKVDFDRLVFHSPFTKLPKKIGAEIIKITRKEKGLEELPNYEIEKLVKEKVGPSLKYSEMVGNIYTGSWFLGLLNLMENGNCNGESVGIGSYGSGGGARFFSGIIIADDNYDSGIKKDLDLKKRIELKPEEYHGVVYGGEKLGLPEQKGCVLKGIDDGFRDYEILD